MIFEPQFLSQLYFYVHLYNIWCIIRQKDNSKIYWIFYFLMHYANIMAQFNVFITFILFRLLLVNRFMPFVHLVNSENKLVNNICIQVEYEEFCIKIKYNYDILTFDFHNGIRVQYIQGGINRETISNWLNFKSSICTIWLNMLNL